MAGKSATQERKPRARLSPIERANVRLAKIVNLIGWLFNHAELSEKGEKYVTDTLDAKVDALAEEWKRRRAEAPKEPEEVSIDIPE